MGNRKQPFGYRMTLGEITIQPEEAELVRFIFQGYSTGATLGELGHVPRGGLRRAVFGGDMERGSVMAGQVAGMLHEIKPLRQIFEELYTGSQAVLKATEAAWR